MYVGTTFVMNITTAMIRSRALQLTLRNNPPSNLAHADHARPRHLFGETSQSAFTKPRFASLNKLP